jgi:hypothetical protein
VSESINLNPGEFKTVPITDVIPYENNPRAIPEDAIDIVAESIRLYGWQQPIVVDKEMVIVVGHTRRLAALSLGMTEVPILITNLPPEKIREYRLVDNRTGEMSGWDSDALVMELREFESDLLQKFFPDIDLEVALVTGAGGPTQQEMDWASEKAATVKDASEASQHTTDVSCPSCEARFKVKTRSLPGMDVKTIEEIGSGI